VKDPRILLEHILESIRRIKSYTKDLSKEDFLKAEQVQDAVIRRLEIIGEAVKNIPGELTKLYPDISWKYIAGLRDIVVHAYFRVDLDLVWKTLIEDIPELKVNISKILQEL